MADSMLQQQLDEVRALLRRARELFGQSPIAPPAVVRSDTAEPTEPGE